MPSSRSTALLITASAFIVTLIGSPTLAQGNSAGRGPVAKGAAPVQGGKPAVPPGQGKPATPTAKANSGAPKAKIVAPVVVKPGLAATLQPLLPGTTVDAAAIGFRNLGQFVAAVHVSENLGIPFTSIKTEMVTNNHSLGEAIQLLKPAADAKLEVVRAEKSAKIDIDQHGK